MSATYGCPRCKATLNPDRSIVLVAAHGDKRALIGFHPQPGNYEMFLPDGLRLNAGERWDFICPVCQASLVTTEGSDLCELELMETSGSLRQLLFSRIAGRRATFVLSDGRVEQAHGEDAEEYRRHSTFMKYLL